MLHNAGKPWFYAEYSNFQKIEKYRNLLQNCVVNGVKSKGKTNDWLDDKEIWYDKNNICRIQSTTQQHWCVYQCWLYAPYWLLGSWEGFINHTRISLFIKRTCHWWTTWICKIISWWNDANMGGCRGHSLFIMLNNPQKF